MILYRLPTTDEGTFGVLANLCVPFAVTLERKWLNNEKGKSCIPDGHYTCKRVQSLKFGETFQVMDVEGRSEILFHKGNIDNDSHGCILIGEMFDPVFKEGVKIGSGILASAQGFIEFMGILKGVSSFELEIKWICR